MTGSTFVAAEVVAELVVAGVDRMFGLPGGGANLELIGEARRRGMDFVLSHMETAACISAATYGYLKGRPGVVTVTRGPGITASSNGIAQATLDRQPLLVIADVVPRESWSRVPHQRVQQYQMAGAISKWVGTLGHGEPGQVARAAAESVVRSPMGSVVLCYDPSAPASAPPAEDHTHGSDSASISNAAAMLGGAQRPVVLVGLEAWPWRDHVRRLVEKLGAPAFETYQARGLISDDSPHLAGVFTNGVIEKPLIESSDLLIAVGLDPVELIPAPWTFQAPVISVMPHAISDTTFPIAVELVGDGGVILDALTTADPAASWTTGIPREVRDHARNMVEASSTGDAFTPIEVVRVLRDSFDPREITYTVDAGAHMLVAVLGLDVSRDHGLLISNGLATMGFAVPAAIGAALARPGERVVALTGDGGLGMTLGELETISRLDLPVTVVVFNDSTLSLIEIKQDSERHGGSTAVRFGKTDFAAIARGFGIPATRVENAAEFRNAVTASPDGPMVIDAVVDPAPYRHVSRVIRG